MTETFDDRSIEAAPQAIVGTPTPPDDVPLRVQVLRTAANAIANDRNKDYGPPSENFARIADFWNIQFGKKLRDGEKFNAADVGDAFILTKMGRSVTGRRVQDTYTDIAGYAGCTWECEDLA